MLDFQRIAERGTKEIVVSAPEQVREVDEYSPMSVRKRVPEEWTRDLSKFPVAEGFYGHPEMALAEELVPVSRQYTWRKARDHAEIMYSYLWGWPRWMASHSFHVHPDAAADKGLAQPNISGLDPTGTLLSSMMLALIGRGWLMGGDFSYRIMRQIGLNDFVTAKGKLVDKREEGPNLRLVCEVWCENQHGDKVVTGAASGVVAN